MKSDKHKEPRVQKKHLHTLPSKDFQTEIIELIELGKLMGPGPRYLFLYYDQLAITNYNGFSRWPEGPKTMIAVIEQSEYVKGISESRKELFLRRAIAYSKEYKRKAG